jgi:hypothetical protein
LLFRRILAIAIPLVLAARAAAAPAEVCEAFPWPDFQDGLAYWTVDKPPYGKAAVVALDDGDIAPAAVELDARLIEEDEISLVSDPFEVEPLAVYELSADIRRIEGAYAFKLAAEWLDEEGRHIAYTGDWSGILVGQNWERYERDVISPRNSRCARVIIELTGKKTDPNCCLVTNIHLTQRAPVGCRLHVDLIHEPIAADERALSKLEVRLENRGDVPAAEVQVSVRLPRGMTCSESLSYEAAGAEGLAFAETHTRTFTLEGRPAHPDELIRCAVSAQVRGQPLRIDTSTRPFMPAPAERPSLLSDLPDPVLPPMKVKLGAYYFPVMIDFQHAKGGVADLPHLRARLGLYNEALPEVADWHVWWAVTHGISFFVYDWYGNQDMDFLSDCLDRGLLESRFKDSIEFAVHWCNYWQPQEYRPFNHSDEGLERMIRTLCERYFSQPNYLKINNRPVLYILMPIRIVNEHGGWEGARKALNRLRAIVLEYGHPGLYLVAVQDSPFMLDLGDAGFDAATAYSFMFRDVPLDETGSAPYQALLPQYRDGWRIARERAHAQGIAYIPTAWAGWDDAGRSGAKRIRTAGNTPGAFRRMLEELPQFVEPGARLAHVEAWNEWGEGTAIEPGEQTGFGYLSAIRNALSEVPCGVDTVPAPTEEEWRTYQTDRTAEEIVEDYFRRAAHQMGLPKGVWMDFESNASLWFRADGDLRYCRIEKGLLTGHSIGENPILVGPPVMDLRGADVDAIQIRMSVEAGHRARLYYITEEDQDWSEEKCFRFSVIADGVLHDYELSTRGAPSWKRGLIRQFRFYPTDAPGRIWLDVFAARIAGQP